MRGPPTTQGRAKGRAQRRATNAEPGWPTLGDADTRQLALSYRSALFTDAYAPEPQMFATLICARGRMGATTREHSAMRRKLVQGTRQLGETLQRHSGKPWRASRQVKPARLHRQCFGRVCRTRAVAEPSWPPRRRRAGHTREERPRPWRTPCRTHHVGRPLPPLRMWRPHPCICAQEGKHPPRLNHSNLDTRETLLGNSLSLLSRCRRALRERVRRGWPDRRTNGVATECQRRTQHLGPNPP